MMKCFGRKGSFCTRHGDTCEETELRWTAANFIFIFEWSIVVVLKRSLRDLKKKRGGGNFTRTLRKTENVPTQEVSGLTVSADIFFRPETFRALTPELSPISTKLKTLSTCHLKPDIDAALFHRIRNVGLLGHLALEVSFAPAQGTGLTYRIMYELAVCSDGMTEAQPRSFRQNRPASEYIIWHNAHSPAGRCSGCSHTCTWIRKKCRLITIMQRSPDRFRFLLP